MRVVGATRNAQILLTRGGGSAAERAFTSRRYRCGQPDPGRGLRHPLIIFPECGTNRGNIPSTPPNPALYPSHHARCWRQLQPVPSPAAAKEYARCRGVVVRQKRDTPHWDAALSGVVSAAHHASGGRQNLCIKPRCFRYAYGRRLAQALGALHTCMHAHRLAPASLIHPINVAIRELPYANGYTTTVAARARGFCAQQPSNCNRLTAARYSWRCCTLQSTARGVSIQHLKSNLLHRSGTPKQTK